MESGFFQMFTRCSCCNEVILCEEIPMFEYEGNHLRFFPVVRNKCNSWHTCDNKIQRYSFDGVRQTAEMSDLSQDLPKLGRIYAVFCSVQFSGRIN